MFQSQRDISEETFIDCFKIAFQGKTMADMPNFPEIEVEVNLKRIHIPNWACIFNKRDRIGKKCIILAKNSRWAIVEFLEDQKTEFYRLGDLSGTNEFMQEECTQSNSGL